MEIFKTLIFVALAASGKSETITFIKTMPVEERVRSLYIGERLIILDDFPYVDMMRAIDAAYQELGELPLFFPDPRQCFLEPQISWKLLILLLNEDYQDITTSRHKKLVDNHCVGPFLERIDGARVKLGARRLFFTPDRNPIIGSVKYQQFWPMIIKKVQGLLTARNEQIPDSLDSLENTTVLIEFARGGEYNSAMPIPYGYADSFSVLSPEILREVRFLYLKVLPEQAALKNFLRADPTDPASILGHCVPYGVMFRDYGCDDFEWLMAQSSLREFILIKSGDGDACVPAAVMDNTKDLTTFVRECKNKGFQTWSEWPELQKTALLSALKTSCDQLHKSMKVMTS